ncbi:hypothetical protein GCM10009569_23350 [Arthrobacter russicus]
MLFLGAFAETGGLGNDVEKAHEIRDQPEQGQNHDRNPEDQTVQQPIQDLVGRAGRPGTAERMLRRSIAGVLLSVF